MIITYYLLTQVYELMQEKKFEWDRNIEKIKSEVKMENANLENLGREGIGEDTRMWDKKLWKDEL